MFVTLDQMCPEGDSEELSLEDISVDSLLDSLEDNLDTHQGIGRISNSEQLLEGAPTKPQTTLAFGQQTMSPPSVSTSSGERLKSTDGLSSIWMADIKDIIQVLETELTTQIDPRRAGRIHFELGRVYEGPLTDIRRAAAHFQEAYNRIPDHLPTLRSMRRVLLGRKSFQAAIPFFDAEIRLTASPEEKASLLFQKGRLYEDRLNLKQEALEAYESALDLDKNNPTYLHAVEYCSEDINNSALLERAYESLANAVSEDGRLRSTYLMARAHILYRNHKNPSAAAQLYETAIALDPQAAGAWDTLKQIYHAEARWRDLISVIEREVSLYNDSIRSAHALTQVAHLYEERLGQSEEAIAALQHALRHQPHDINILAELARLLERVDDYPALVETLSRYVDTVTDENERLALLHRVGQLTEEKLRDPDAAIPWYERAVEVEPSYVPALQSLGALYTRRQDWDALARMHLAEADASQDPVRRAAACVRVAELFELHLDRIGDAIAAHARALTFVHLYPPSFKALTRLFAQTNRHQELAALYEQAIDHTAEKDRCIAYLNKIASIYEDSLDDPRKAATVFQRILAIDAGNIGAIHALQRSAERSRQYLLLIEAIELEIQITEDTKRHASLYHRAAEILEDELSDAEGALVRYLEALRADSKHIPTLTRIGRLYFKLGRWNELKNIFEQELTLAIPGPQSVALLHKLGELCEFRLGNEDEAVECYRRAVSADPTHRPSLRALKRKLRAKQAWTELVRVMELELDTNKDPDERALAFTRLADIYEAHLRMPERAIALYEQCLKELPAYRPAADALNRARAQLGQWSRLVEELSNRASRADDATLSITSLMRAGMIWRDELGEPRRAILAFEAVLSKSPNHLGALVALENLYRKVGAWDKLISVYTKQAELYTDVETKKCAERELARIFERRGPQGLHDLELACHKILELDPHDHFALTTLERIALETRDFETLVGVDSELSQSSRDPKDGFAYHLRLAESLELLGRPDALEAYRRALRIDSESLIAIRGLRRTAQMQDDAPTITFAMRLEANNTSDLVVASDLYYACAQLDIEVLNDTSSAQQDLERALEINPDNANVADMLARLLLASGQLQRLLDRLSDAFTRATQPHRVAALAIQVARLQSDLFDNLPSAIATMEKATRLAPRQPEAHLKLAELFERNHQWEQAKDHLEELLGLEISKEVRLNTLVNVATIYIDHLNASELAKAHLEAVLAIDPNHRPALERLSHLHLAVSDFENAIMVSERLVSVSIDPLLRGQALVQLALAQRNRQNNAAAMRTLLDAMASAGLDSNAHELYVSHIDPEFGWHELANALRQFTEHFDEDAFGSLEPLVAAWAELARIEEHILGDPSLALESLRRAFQDTAHAQFAIAIARALHARGRDAEAVQMLTNIVPNEIQTPDVWRELSMIYATSGDHENASRALEPLVWLNIAFDTEVGSVQQRLAGPLQLPKQYGDTSYLRGFDLNTPSDHAAADLLGVISESLPKLYPPDFEGYGLSARDKMTPKSHGVFLALVARVAAFFGVGQYDMYLHRVRTRTLMVELGNPPAILVPAHVLDLPESQQVFMLAKVFANIERGLHPVHKLTPREIEIVLASAARTMEKDFGTGLTSEEFMQEHGRKIVGGISRKNRRLFESAIATYVETPQLDFAGWVTRVDSRANLLATLVTDDLSASIEAMRRSDRDLVLLTPQELLERTEAVSDVVSNWMSNAAYDLRKLGGVRRS